MLNAAIGLVKVAADAAGAVVGLAVGLTGLATYDGKRSPSTDESDASNKYND